MTTYFTNPEEQIIFSNFVEKFSISEHQAQQFKQYFDLIVQENQKYNITAITGVREIILDHFYDSLSLILFYDMKKIQSLADVGSGGGFPGIPLAIMCPEVQINLIEVNNKKVHFLGLVASQLGLSNVSIHTDDWRTFLRKFELPIDLFVARASLQLDELIRIFKPSSRFQESVLVYWASKKWIATGQEREYLDTCVPYGVGDKERSLCFFMKNKLNQNLFI
ncbi:MAG: 16S rRNA (guanine(527)-N(7))-methyltransferase RsmG [Candidatus Dependentiae bacterium]|nr:16S rRNA (guanine(527)-N(7))-methyltransferase RsmG [Candidatus Dependentiae bacterium]